MKKFKKPRRLDFLPNKLNKYSIRKFTVGTASILIGSLLYLGIQNQADASEINEQTKAETQVFTNNSLNSDEEDSSVNTVAAQQSSEQNTDVEKTVEAAPFVEEQNNDEQRTTQESNNTEKFSENKVINEELTSTEDISGESAKEDKNIENSNDENQVEEPSAEEKVTENNKKPDAKLRNVIEKDNVLETKVSSQGTSNEDGTVIDTETEETNPPKSPLNTSVESNYVSETNENVTSRDAQFDEVVSQNLPKNFNVLSAKEAEAAITYAQLKAYAEKMNQQPTAALLNLSTSSSNAFYRSALRAVGDTTTQMVTVSGTEHFKKYGDVVHQTYPEEFPNAGTLTAINPVTKPNTGTKGALQFDQQISFDKDFRIKLRVANNNQSNTTDSDGWGFIFTTGSGQDFLDQGGILRDRGMANAAGFKIDTSYNNVGGKADPLDKDKTNNLTNIGAVKIGYGTFVKNGADGTTQQVGTNALGSKDKPVNKIQYADNATDYNDGKFHGQRLNDVILSYDAASSTLTATYAGKTWQATVNDLGLNKSDKYNFLITSSQMANRYSNGIMRTDLSAAEITIPAEIPQTETHEPGYEEGRTKPNVPVTVPQTGDTTIPPGSQYEIPTGGVPEGWTAEVDPNNGTVTVTPPADATPGTSVDIPVKVTYPDGSSEETPAKVTVVPNDAQDNTPGYEEGHTKPNVPVEVPQTKDPNVPPGTTFEIPPAGIPEGWTAEVDPDNGTVTVTPPADATPGTSVDIPVKVTYPDGSSEETPVKVTVDTPDSGNHDPGYEEGHTKPNVPVEVP
ncbi:YPDG domain-containing protein, partial [Staphylococcus pseudintermedius]|nr:YPDG domain-containing protein [Staphylococcus pseudintermedius]